MQQQKQKCKFLKDFFLHKNKYIFRISNFFYSSRQYKVFIGTIYLP